MQIKVFVIVQLVNANVLKIMMVLLVKEQFVPMVAVMLVFVSPKNNLLLKLDEFIPHHGMLRNMLDVFVILVVVVQIVHLSNVLLEVM